MVADEPRRRQLGVALDELHPEPGTVRDRPQERRLPGSGRPFEHDVAAAGERRREHLGLAAQADDALVDPREQRPASVVVDDHSSDVLAVEHVLEAQGDVVERVPRVTSSSSLSLPAW